MELYDFQDYVYEYSVSDDYSISFSFKNEKYELKSNSVQGVFKKTVDFLYKNNYKFDESVKSRKLINLDEIPDSYKPGLPSQNVYNIPGTKKYILCNFGPKQLIRNMNIMLIRLGVDEKTIKFNDNLNFEKIPELQKDKISSFSEVIKKEEEPKKNPFVNSLCILGDTGAGKTVTIENILDNEGHKCIIILPSIIMTSLLVQYNPDTNRYVLSRLGRHMKRAAENPNELYTVIFDECHRYLPKINDEILQAMSEKRNIRGIRYITLEEPVDKLYSFLNQDEKERFIMPQNLGFVFISSHDDAIFGNDDFVSRISWIYIKRDERSLYKTISNLIDSRVEKKNEYGKSLPEK